MPVKWIARDHIDEAKWTACAASCPQTDSICARPWYLDGCGEWDALVEDDYRAVLPLFRHKKWGVHYIYPPFFTGQLGILGQPAAGIPAWLQAIPRRFLRSEILLNASNGRPEQWQGKVITHQTFLLDLQTSYDHLRGNYSQNHLRNLKKAEEAGLRIVREVPQEAVIRMFREHRGRERKVGYREKDYQRLSRLLETLDRHHAMESWGVTDAQGILCAAAFFPFLPHRYTFLFSGRNSASGENRAMFFLADRFIRSHAGSAAILDFNGSNNPAVARFYSGFGAKAQPFFQFNSGLGIH